MDETLWDGAKAIEENLKECRDVINQGGEDRLWEDDGLFTVGRIDTKLET